MTGRDAVIIGLLAVAAFIGNYNAIALMYGVDVLVGGLFVYVLLLRYGLAVALVAGLPALLATWALWNHLYAAFLLLSELLALGLLLRRQPERELPLLVALLWLPWLCALCLLFYHGPLGLPLTDSLVVMLKQALNSIANAVLAVVVTTLLSLRWPRHQYVQATARQVLFYIPAAVVVLAVVLMLFSVSRMQWLDKEANVAERLAQTRQTLMQQTHTAVSRLEQSLAQIDQRCLDDAKDDVALARCIHILLPFSNWQQVLVSWDPQGDWQIYGPEGRLTPAPQPAALADLEVMEPPQLATDSRASHYRLTPASELYLLRRHDNDGGGWIGGMVRMNRPGQDIWRPFPDPAQRQSWRLDGVELLSSGPPLSAQLSQHDEAVESGAGLRHFMPGAGELSPMRAWTHSVYYLDIPAADLGLPLPGVLRLELSSRQEQLRLYRLYAVLLLVGVALIFAVLLLSHWAADRLMRPTRALIAAAESIPLRVSQPPDQWRWPDRLVVREMHDLQHSLEKVSRLLHEQYQRERLSRQWLENEIAERTRDLQAAQQHIGSLLANMEGVLFSAEYRHGRVKVSWISPAVTTLTGYPPADWTGDSTRLWERLARHDRPLIKAELQRMGQQRRGEFSMNIHHAQGDCRHLRVRYWTVDDELGGYSRLDGLVTDSTDWQAAQQKIREQEALLIQQARSAALGEMLSNIAHQWRQPLNSLSLIQANLRDAQSYGELSDHYLLDSLDRSDALIARMNQTVRDFLTFFRPGREPQQFDLTQTVKDGLTLLENTLSSRPIELRQQLTADLQVRGYPNELVQVLMVLIQNSREALEERRVAAGRIEVRLEAVGTDARLSVEDNAGGLDEVTLERVFDPYFTTKAEGTGIGLYMARSLIENQMGGRISANNGRNGACFSIYLPLSKS